MDQSGDVKFWVGYDDNGEVVDVKPGDGAKLVDVKEPPFKTADLVKITGGENFEIKTTPLMHLYSSPGCWVVIGGKVYYIC